MRSSAPPPSPGRFIHFADAAAPPPTSTGRWRSLDENAVTVLAVLLCGTVCALAVNSAVRCLLRRSRQRCGGAAEGLPVLAFSSGMKMVGAGAAECAICLTEFAEGDRVRVLAPCNHGFHAKCVDRWVAKQSSCPYCRGCLAAPAARRPDLRQPSPLSGQAPD